MKLIDIFSAGNKKNEPDDLQVYEVNPNQRRGQEEPEKQPSVLWETINGWLTKLRLPEDPITRMLAITVGIAILASFLGVIFYGKVHTYDRYRISKSADRSADKTLAGLAMDENLTNTVGDADNLRLDVDGTNYTMLGGRVIKFSHDGVFCVNLSNETQWSIAYSIQTPICSIRGRKMVIAEQQGNQVYVFNEKGLLGSFSTALPILRADISENGVVSMILKDEDITWINMYDMNGAQLSSIKTTLEDTGYPICAAISDNGRNLAVSYACVKEGILTGKLTFYDFSKADSQESHVMGELEYSDAVFPQVYFIGSNEVAAAADNGFVVVGNMRSPVEKKRVQFEKEIVSIFHDDENIGFIFHSDQPDRKYELVVYRYNGHHSMTSTFDFEYQDVRMDNGEVLLYDASTINVYRTSGRQKVAIDYEREVKYFASMSGRHRYLVITSSSMDQIQVH